MTASTTTATSSSAALTAALAAALRTPLQRLGAALAVLGLLVAVGAVVGGQQAQHRAWDALDVCGADGSGGDCLEVREGRFDVRGPSDDATVWFWPDGERGRDRVGVDERHLRGERSTARAIYLGEDVVGIEGRDGERHWRSGTLDVPVSFALGLAGGVLLLLGGVALVVAGRRR